MSLGNEKDDMFYLILLFAFFENEQKKWEQLRSKGTEPLELVQQEYTEYFNKLFQGGIPNYSLKLDTQLFRARQIKNNDAKKLEVNMSSVLDTVYKIFLTDEDMNKMERINNNGVFSISLYYIFLLKLQGMKEFTEEQCQRKDEILKKYSTKQIYGFSEGESRVPPPLFRKAGRLNTASDAYLYAAFDRDTAIHEMRPSIGQSYSIAEFRLNKEVKIADLTGRTISPEKDNTSFHFLADKISEPNTDNVDEFYHITQHMAHMIQEKGYDGIMYKSALKKEKNNILLFDETNVDFIASEIVEINDVNIDYSNILPISNDSNE